MQVLMRIQMAFRSILFTPANRLDRVAKGMVAGPDWVALDLEDGVLESEKDQSRDMVMKYFTSGQTERQRIAIRINSLSTSHGVRDMNSMIGWSNWPEMIIVPKVESKLQIQQIRELAREFGKEPHIMATIETALGFENIAQILSGNDPKLTMAFGSADYTAQTGGNMEPVSLAWARGRIVNAAASANIPVLDGVWLDFRDEDGLRTDAKIAKEIGFTGKIAIHPDQIKVINEIFTPTEAEIDEAKKLLKVAENFSDGAFSFKGRMIDPPVLAKARQILDSAGKR